MESSNAPRVVDDAIVQRKTTKVLASAPLPENEHWAASVQDLLKVAAMAPFHRPCDASHQSGGLDGIEPWRFYILGPTHCRQLANDVPREQAGKIPAMLNAADALVMVTWLPNPPGAEAKDGQLFEPTLANMEHIAAASSAIQNVLVAATARAIPSYWSSGGILRSPELFSALGISTTEILLGAVFLFPADPSTDLAEVVGSKLRDKRTGTTSWSREVELNHRS